MATGESIGITTPMGFRAAGVHCGIKPDPEALDLMVLVSEVPAVAGATFTTNKVCGAPVRVSRPRIEAGRAVRAVVVSSGCANVCTGAEGIDDARRMTQLVAEGIGAREEEVLVASTGKIGTYLPMERVEAGIARALETLGRGSAADEAAARAIMTTDTFPKRAGLNLAIDGVEGTLAGIAKGAGMIQPQMATMIAVITTDLAVEQQTLRFALTNAVDRSFNMVTVDGHTSTSDTVFFLSSGLAGNEPLTREHTQYAVFAGALEKLCVDLAKQIARDGEGARKLIEIEVTGAARRRDARRVAKAVANSPLVKAALAAGEPNWGRIVGAAGTATAAVDEYKLRLWLGEHLVFDAGRPVPVDEDRLRQDLVGEEISIHIDLGLGTARAVCWTCDLTEDYVRINYH